MIPSHGAPAGSPETAVGLADGRRCRSRPRARRVAGARRRDEVVLTLEGRHARRRARRGSPPGTRARADLEDPVARCDLEQLGHPRDDHRLADGLAGIDRKRFVGVGPVAPAVGDEGLARDRAHRFEHTFVGDAPARNWRSTMRPVRRRIEFRAGHRGEDTPHPIENQRSVHRIREPSTPTRSPSLRAMADGRRRRRRRRGDAADADAGDAEPMPTLRARPRPTRQHPRRGRWTRRSTGGRTRFC